MRPNKYVFYGLREILQDSAFVQSQIVLGKGVRRVQPLEADEDLEDDDMDLYYKLSIPDQILLMKIRQTLQSAIINKQALYTMDYLENDLMKRIHNKREIQEAKINLIKMLSECETEEELIQVMRLKDTFMSTYCFEDRNPNFEEHEFDREEYDQLMHELNPATDLSSNNNNNNKDSFSKRVLHLQDNEKSNSILHEKQMNKQIFGVTTPTK